MAKEMGLDRAPIELWKLVFLVPPNTQGARWSKDFPGSGARRLRVAIEAFHCPHRARRGNQGGKKHQLSYGKPTHSCQTSAKIVLVVAKNWHKMLLRTVKNLPHKTCCGNTQRRAVTDQSPTTPSPRLFCFIGMFSYLFLVLEWFLLDISLFEEV